jgi:uncharacterized protein YggU (UPF0235/DUF167 family)
LLRPNHRIGLDEVVNRWFRSSKSQSGRETGWMRVSVRVKPGASRTMVGGQYGEAPGGQGGVLIVRVGARAVEGAATEAVLKAVAKAFGLRRADVGLVSGLTSRTKVLELQGEERTLSTRLTQLLGS